MKTRKLKIPDPLYDRLIKVRSTWNPSISLSAIVSKAVNYCRKNNCSSDTKTRFATDEKGAVLTVDVEGDPQDIYRMLDFYLHRYESRPVPKLVKEFAQLRKDAN